MTRSRSRPGKRSTQRSGDFTPDHDDISNDSLAAPRLHIILKPGVGWDPIGRTERYPSVSILTHNRRDRQRERENGRGNDLNGIIVSTLLQQEATPGGGGVDGGGQRPTPRPRSRRGPGLSIIDPAEDQGSPSFYARIIVERHAAAR